MCLFDDVMLRVALDDNIPLAGLLLRIVLGEPKLEVKSVTTQRRMNINVKTKGVIFDALVLLADGRQVVIEMQIKDEKNIFHRSRFYSDMLDAHALLQGSPYTELPDRIIVVFCDWDVFGQGKPVYNVGTWLEGDVFKPVDMGMRYVYVNMTYNGDDDYGRLNNDLAQPSGGFFHFRETEEARELIFEAPWRDQMYTDLSDLIAEMNADEIIVTSSSALCMKAASIDRIPVGGKDPKRLKLLQDAYLEKFQRETTPHT